ncbi:hypothetical protein [Dyella sp. S184]|jgi:hypothetical protein|uniref:hypothetical protein n=1 Tax=Dyella sp. S184 TaxID=1641862 RepID=UPI00131AB976|nr:hypothetical protein [Dyella sp. S184]
MPHFALTRQGYDQLIKVCGGSPPSPLWVNAGVLSSSELTVLRTQGLDVTEFARLVSSEGQGLDDAIGTIKEHHPGLSVWVEHAA